METEVREKKLIIKGKYGVNKYSNLKKNNSKLMTRKNFYNILVFNET